MTFKQIVFGERSLTKVAALFENRSSAETTLLRLRQVANMSDSQLTLVGPTDLTGVADAPLSRKLEPEQSGIWQTVLRAHAVTGVIGLLAGGVLYFSLRLAGNAAILGHPVLNLMVMLMFGGIFGLLAGGLLSLRPDHYRVMAAVRKAIKHGRWAVVSHPVNQDQTELIIHELHRRGVPVVRSF
jgi:hypothetical protein